MSENNGEFGAFLAGFVIGGLVGAATALILAPQSGSETRSQIANKGSELRTAGGRRLHPSESTEEILDDMSINSAIDDDASQQARIVLDSGRQSVSGNDSGETDSDNEEETE